MFICIYNIYIQISCDFDDGGGVLVMCSLVTTFCFQLQLQCAFRFDLVIVFWLAFE